MVQGGQLGCSKMFLWANHLNDVLEMRIAVSAFEQRKILTNMRGI